MSATPSAVASAASHGPSASASPAASGSFGFAAEDIAAYYLTHGFTCLDPVPSTQAVGFLYRGCQKIDPAARTLVVGLVTDPQGLLANAFAGVSASPTETIVEPADALDHLSSFLGAVLGKERGGTAAVWLTEHLGLAYEQTTVGDLTIATYAQGPTDASRIFVEVANAAYRLAPGGSAQP